MLETVSLYKVIQHRLKIFKRAAKCLYCHLFSVLIEAYYNCAKALWKQRKQIGDLDNLLKRPYDNRKIVLKHVVYHSLVNNRFILYLTKISIIKILLYKNN